MELISIIIPVYNVEQYLRECLDSIIKQTYKNLEIILVDDGSLDKSGEICDEYKLRDDRIIVIHKENGGLSDARNTGMEIAQGKYIQFIDSDDYIDEDMIETLYHLITENSADISMCSNYILVGEKATSNSSGKKYIYNRIDALKEILLDEKIRSYAWNKLMKKDILKDIKFPKGKVFEDILTIPKIFEKSSKIVYFDVPKYYYRQREGSILNKQTNALRLAYIQAATEINKFIEEKEPSLKNYCAYNIAHITIKTYNDIGFFNMYELLNETIVNDLYEQTKEIFEKEEYEELIVKNSTKVKKLHFYYLLVERDGYIKNNKTLPVIYPEYEEKLKNRNN